MYSHREYQRLYLFWGFFKELTLIFFVNNNSSWHYIQKTAYKVLESECLMLYMIIQKAEHGWRQNISFIWNYRAEHGATRQHQYSIHSVPDCIYESKTNRIADGSDDSFLTKAFVHSFSANCYSTNWNIWAFPSLSVSLPSKPASPVHEPSM